MIYLDHAATTPLNPKVLEKMLPYFSECFYNPSSSYRAAGAAREAIDHARQEVASLINAQAGEIFFTASGTESDNWAVKSAPMITGKKHIITTAIEHHAVLHACQNMEQNGYKVTYLAVDNQGMVDPAQLESAICQDTGLVSIIFANNEIGTIQPIKELARIAKFHGAIFHTDAVQAGGALNIDVVSLGVDLLSLSGHKLYAPKGIGALYIKGGVPLKGFMHGGAQERKRRAGTENVPAIVGFGEACRLAKAALEGQTSRLVHMRDALIKGVTHHISRVRVTGHPTERLPGIASFVVEGIEGESMLLELDRRGFAASSGSACTSASLDPSHVLLACGIPHEIAHGSLRVSLGASNTMEQVNQFIPALVATVDRLREMSPIWP